MVGSNNSSIKQCLYSKGGVQVIKTRKENNQNISKAHAQDRVDVRAEFVSVLDTLHGAEIFALLFVNGVVARPANLHMGRRAQTVVGQ